MRSLILLLFTTLIIHSVAADPRPALHNTQTIPLTGVQGRIDHMAFDAKSEKLYVAALGNNTVEVIDLKAGKQVARLTGMKKPQGIAVVPDTARVIVASGEDGMVRIFDETGKLLGSLDNLDDADNVRYDPQSHLAYVGYGEGALAVIDPQKVEKVADIKLDKHPESFRLEPQDTRIYINIPDAQEIAVVDRQTRQVIAKWPLKEAKSNFPMALDSATHRLFIGCRNPARVLVLDTESGKVLSSAPCAGDTDDLFFDSAANRLYVSGGEGFVTILDRKPDDQFHVLEKISIAPGARTSLFVPERHSLFVAVPHRDKQQAELRVLSSKN